MMKKKEPNIFSNTSSHFNVKSGKNYKNVVDVSIPFLFPYIVGNDKSGQSKVFYNTASSFTSKDEQSTCLGFNVQLAQSRFLQSKEMLHQSQQVPGENKNISQKNEQKTIVIRSSKVVKGMSYQKTLMKSRNKPFNLARRNGRNFKSKFMDVLLNQRHSQLENAQPIEQNNLVQEMRDSSIKRNSSNSNLTRLSRQAKQKRQSIQKRHSKQTKQGTEGRQSITTGGKQRPSRSNAFVKHQSRPSGVKLSLISQAKRITKTKTEPSENPTPNTPNKNTENENPKQSLSKFGKRNTTIVGRQGGFKFRQSLAPPAVNNIQQTAWAQVPLKPTSFLNLIQEQDFKTLSVINEDGNTKPPHSLILKPKSRVTILNENEPSRLSRTSNLSRRTTQTKTILRKTYNKSIQFVEPGRQQSNSSERERAPPPLESRNILINHRRHPTNISHKSYKSTKPIKSSKSIKSMKSNKSNHTQYSSQFTQEPDIAELLKPKQSNSVYNYLNHLISKNHFKCEDQISSSSSIHSLTNIDLYRRGAQMRSKVENELSMLKGLQHINGQGNPLKYEEVFSTLLRNENKNSLILERSEEFDIETQMLRILRGVEVNTNRLAQRLKR